MDDGIKRAFLSRVLNSGRFFQRPLAHVRGLMMKVRKEAMAKGGRTLFGKVVTMTFSNGARLMRDAVTSCFSGFQRPQRIV